MCNDAPVFAQSGAQVSWLWRPYYVGDVSNIFSGCTSRSSSATQQTDLRLRIASVICCQCSNKWQNCWQQLFGSCKVKCKVFACLRQRKYTRQALCIWQINAQLQVFTTSTRSILVHHAQKGICASYCLLVQELKAVSHMHKQCLANAASCFRIWQLVYSTAVSQCFVQSPGSFSCVL